MKKKFSNWVMSADVKPDITRLTGSASKAPGFFLLRFLKKYFGFPRLTILTRYRYMYIVQYSFIPAFDLSKTYKTYVCMYVYSARRPTGTTTYIFTIFSG
jgi:hypothetical protein